MKTATPLRAAITTAPTAPIAPMSTTKREPALLPLVVAESAPAVPVVEPPVVFEVEEEWEEVPSAACELVCEPEAVDEPEPEVLEPELPEPALVVPASMSMPLLMVETVWQLEEEGVKATLSGVTVVPTV